MKPRTATLTEGSVRRQLFDLTWPMIGGLAAMMSFHFADTWFVARLGADQLAAMSFTFPVVMMLTSLGIGLMAGTSSVLARVIGRGDHRQLGRLTTDALLVSLVIAALAAALGLAVHDPLFRLLGAPEPLLAMIRDYMLIWFAGFPVYLLPMVGVGAIRATGDAKLQSLILVVGALVNLVLDPLLIFGLAGLPALGLEGAALATVIARATGVIWVLYALHARKRMLGPLPGSLASVWASARALLHVGLPAAGTNMIIPASTGVVVWMLSRHDEAAVAGFGAAMRIENVALVVLYAMSSMIGPFVGQNLGAGRVDRVRQALRDCARFCTLFGAALAVVLALAAERLVALFSDDPAVTSVGIAYLLAVPLGYGAQGVVMVINAAFNGLGRPGPAVVVSTVRSLALYLPAAWLGQWLLGVPGIFVAACVTNIVCGVGAYLWSDRMCAEMEARSRANAAGVMGRD